MDVGELAPDAHNDTVALVGGELLARWNEPARRYHTTTHLVEMFWALEELEGGDALDARDTALARVGAWFHDAVYDPTAPPGANEARSADLARDTLPSLRFGEDDIATVVGLVELTAGHDTPSDRDVDLAFQDADLWILAAETERFDGYCDQVREEYAHVPDATYRQGRTAVLEPLLLRASIYRTAYGQASWETAARANLARELARLIS